MSPITLTMNHKTVLCTLLATFLLIHPIAGIDHCNEHKFNSNATHMMFTKEKINQEYAVLGQFKSLHCCAKGYRSIEWFKDDGTGKLQPYPWSGETSSLILYPEAANQTIYSRSASNSDNGKYLCVLRNETHKTEHYIDLQIKSNSPDTPLATFHPHDLFVNIGDPARFYCEAFIGKVDLPDVITGIKWYQVFEDNQEIVVAEHEQESVKREDGQIVGSYLEIHEVKAHNYGRYLCRIEIGNSNTHRLEMSSWLILNQPIKANEISFMLNPYLLAMCAAVIVICLFLLLKMTRDTWIQYFLSFTRSNKKCTPSTSSSNLPTTSLTGLRIQKPCSVRHSKLNDDSVRIMIGT